MFGTLSARLRPWSCTLRRAALALLALAPSASLAEEPLRLKVVGGLADVSQYVRQKGSS